MAWYVNRLLDIDCLNPYSPYISMDPVYYPYSVPLIPAVHRAESPPLAYEDATDLLWLNSPALIIHLLQASMQGKKYID